MKDLVSEEKNIRRDALNYLSRRDHSRTELAQKLRRKHYSLDAIDRLLTDLAQAGFLSDQRFAENYCYSRRTKGYGPLRITLELEARGVHADIITDIINLSDNTWLTEAQQLWRKRFKATLPTDYKTRAKQMRFLQYRGYTQEQIEFVIEE